MVSKLMRIMGRRSPIDLLVLAMRMTGTLTRRSLRWVFFHGGLGHTSHNRPAGGYFDD